MNQAKTLDLKKLYKEANLVKIVKKLPIIPIILLSPILTPFRIIASVPIQTSFSIIIGDDLILFSL